MSKQIIKNGIYNVTDCPKCACQFAFEKTDIEESGKVTCPQCGTECDAKKPE